MKPADTPMHQCTSSKSRKCSVTGQSTYSQRAAFLAGQRPERLTVRTGTRSVEVCVDLYTFAARFLVSRQALQLRTYGTGDSYASGSTQETADRRSQTACRQESLTNLVCGLTLWRRLVTQHCSSMVRVLPSESAYLCCAHSALLDLQTKINNEYCSALCL